MQENLHWNAQVWFITFDLNARADGKQTMFNNFFLVYKIFIWSVTDIMANLLS